MIKFQDQLRLLILGSLVVISLKLFFELLYILIFVENKFYVSNGFIPLLLALTVGQIFGIMNKEIYLATVNDPIPSYLPYKRGNVWMVVWLCF